MAVKPICKFQQAFNQLGSMERIRQLQERISENFQIFLNEISKEQPKTGWFCDFTSHVKYITIPKPSLSIPLVFS